MTKIPKNGTWDQLNISDALGTLWASYNLDLTENQSRVRLGKRMLLNTATADLADITSYPAAFWLCGTAIHTFAGASDTGYDLDNDGTLYGAFARETAGTEPTVLNSNQVDAIFNNNALYVISARPAALTSYSFYKKIGNGNWAKTDIDNSIVNAGYPSAMCGYAGRTYASVSQSKIISWDSSDTVVIANANTLLPSGIAFDFSTLITCMRAGSNRIWICTVNTTGGKGRVYEWDGASQQATKVYNLESSGALSCVIKDDVPYIMDTNGVLLAWNGGTFKEVARLNRKNNKLLYNPISLVNDRFIHPNGMTIIKGKICMLIDGRNYDNTATIEETIPSGVYEYIPNTAGGIGTLYHKHSIGLTKSGGTITDYGAMRLAGVGALTEINLPSTSSSRNGTFLAGVSYYTDATTVKSGIFYDDSNDTLKKAGSFITTWIGTDNIEESWQNVFPKYRKLLSSNDKITVKYRDTYVPGIEATITWSTVGASSTTITSTADLSTVAVGDEIEITQGMGAGRTAHVLTNSGNVAGTYTLTVDEVYSGVSGTAKARFVSWIKIGSITQDTKAVKLAPIKKSATKVQLKLCMIFTGQDEIESVDVSSKPQLLVI